jgi:hemerythrin-like metal-binding protein
VLSLTQHIEQRLAAHAAKPVGETVKVPAAGEDGAEAAEDGVDEEERRMEQRLADVEDKLLALGHIVPRPVILRVAIGTTLLVIIVSIFFSVGIIYCVGITRFSADLICSGFRTVLVIQTSALATMVVSNTSYPLDSPDFLYAKPSFTSPVFRNSSYAASYHTLAETLEGIAEQLKLLSDLFILGTEASQPTGDALFDSIPNVRTQGAEEYLDMVMTHPRKCFPPNGTECVFEQLPGVAEEFNGLSELVTRFEEAAMKLAAMDPDQVVESTLEYQYIRLSSNRDLRYAFTMIGTHLEEQSERYSSEFLDTMLILFIVLLVLLILCSVLFFLPIPGALRHLQTLTRQIRELHQAQVRSASVRIEWEDEYATGAPGLDAAHEQIVDTMGEVLTAIVEKAGNDVIADMLEHILLYTATHMAAEEALMSKFDIPLATRRAHEMTHVKTMEKLLRLWYRRTRGKGTIHDADVAFTAVINDDIRVADAPMVSFLFEKAPRAVLAEPIAFDTFVPPPSLVKFVHQSDKKAKIRKWYKQFSEAFHQFT